MTTIDWDTVSPTRQEAERSAFDDMRVTTEPSCPPELTIGDDQFCVIASICEYCNLTICPDHSNEFTTCADGTESVLHHLTCAADCEYCVDAAREDAAWREEGW